MPCRSPLRGALVKISTCLFYIIEIVGRPDPDSAERSAQCDPEVCEFVFDLRRHDRIHRTYHQTITLHRAQGLREHFLTDSLNQFTKPAETQRRLLREYVEDQHRPFVCNATDEIPD